MLTQENERKIIAVLNEEAHRIGYGKVLVEVTVLKGQITNVSAETKRSLNIN